METESGDTSDWTLGRLVPREAVTLVGEPAGFTAARRMPHDEHLQLHGAYDALATVNLSRLLTPFHIAGREFLDAASEGVSTGEYLALNFDTTMRVNGTFDATLAALTQAQTQVERAAAQLGDQCLTDARTDFRRLRAASADFLLLWQLRNLSQHQRAASNFLAIAREDGIEHLIIPIDEVFAFVDACRLKPNYQRAWDLLREARKDTPATVNVFDALLSARADYDLYVARTLSKSALAIDSRIREVATAYVDACDSKLGVAVVRRDGAEHREQWVIDPRTFEGSMLTMNWASELVGREPQYALPAEGLFPDPPAMVWTEHRPEE